MGHGSRSRRRDEAEGDDDASDAAREEARERQREHKHRQRRRKTERRHAAVNEILSKIAPPSRASFTSLEDTPAWRDGNPIEWSSMGPSCDPASMANDGNEATMRGDDANKGASTTAAAAAQPVVNLRAMRKRWQVESFAVVLRELERERAARDDADAMPPMRVVDFGAGSGNLILPLAKRFPDVRFTAVEMKRRSAEILERRAAAAGLTNVDVVVDMIEKTTFGFDVGVALHACGNATDFTIARCLAAAAAFAVSPCCIGKLKFSLAGGSSFSATNKDWTAKGGDGESMGTVAATGRRRWCVHPSRIPGRIGWRRSSPALGTSPRWRRLRTPVTATARTPTPSQTWANGRRGTWSWTGWRLRGRLGTRWSRCDSSVRRMRRRTNPTCSSGCPPAGPGRWKDSGYPS